VKDTWGYVLRRLARDNFYAVATWSILWADERIAVLHARWKGRTP
jgi:hypothetical protein